MFIEVRLPELAEGMTSAKLANWLKREGDPVTVGEPIAEVETDKTNVEIEAPGSGVLTHIHVAAGTDPVAVGSLLAMIGEQSQPGKDPPGRPSAGAADAPGEEVLARSFPGSTPAPFASTIPIVTPATGTAPVEAEERRSPTDVTVTPLAAWMAKLGGLDLSAIRPTGTGGRITKADIETELRERQLSASVADTGSFSDRPLSAIRRVTATRLQHAKQTIPHFYLRVDCTVGTLTDLRARLNASSSRLRITITDLIVLASAQALRKVRLANSTWSDAGVRVYNSVDIAVAVNTPKGLVAPVVRACEQKTLEIISRELKQLSEQARRGQLKPNEYTGGTFTISNLGMFGVTSITPIINPPQTCMLGVGAIERRPVVVDGQTTIGEVMSCTLAADHRAIDGVTGAELLAEIRRLIENPMSMAQYVAIDISASPSRAF